MCDSRLWCTRYSKIQLVLYWLFQSRQRLDYLLTLSLNSMKDVELMITKVETEKGNRDHTIRKLQEEIAKEKSVHMLSAKLDDGQGPVMSDYILPWAWNNIDCWYWRNFADVMQFLSSNINSCVLIKVETRPGVENVKPKGWFKYSLQRDKGVVLDCSTMSLSTWETYIWSILHWICLPWMLAFW